MPPVVAFEAARGLECTVVDPSCVEETPECNASQSSCFLGLLTSKVEDEGGRSGGGAVFLFREERSLPLDPGYLLDLWVLQKTRVGLF